MSLISLISCWALRAFIEICLIFELATKNRKLFAFSSLVVGDMLSLCLPLTTGLHQTSMNESLR